MLKKVFIASESAYRRTLISEMLSSHKLIQVIDIVRNAKEALELLKNTNPDILILDIEFKNKDWFKPFNSIIKTFKFFTIVLTDFNPKKLDRLDIPPIIKSNDYIIKPVGVWKEELPKIMDTIISKVLNVHVPKLFKIDSKNRIIEKNAFIRQSQKSKTKSGEELRSSIQNHNDLSFKPSFESKSEKYFLELAPVHSVRTKTKIIVIGASVGGPRTLRSILSEVPKNFPAPILVVQHLNHLFMRQLVTSLKSICKLNVKIGKNYEIIHPGIIYVSPGGKHMQVSVKNNEPCIRTFGGEPVNYCRPSVDVLFYSAARIYKQKTLGILLTGMGKDGVEGLGNIKSMGGITIAESEETSILYGMPKIAAETGVANLIVPNYKITEEMIKFVG